MVRWKRAGNSLSFLGGFSTISDWVPYQTRLFDRHSFPAALFDRLFFEATFTVRMALIPAQARR